MATLMARYKDQEGKFKQKAVDFNPRNGKPVPVENATSFFVLYTDPGGKRKATKGTTFDLALIELQNRERAKTAKSVERSMKSAPPSPAKEFTRELLNHVSATSGPTLREALDQYLSELENGKSQATYTSYRNAVQEFIGHVGPDKPIASVTRDTVLLYKKWLYTQDLSETTRYHRVLNVVIFLKYFGTEKLLRKGDWPKPNEKAVDAYSKEELAALFKAANPEEKLLLEFFLFSGARDMEVAHATKADIAVNGGATFAIRAKGVWRTKSARDRKVPIPVEFAERLLRARENHGPDNFLFCDSNGHPCASLWRILQRVAKRAGVENATLHKFRRTFATMHSEKGTPIQTIQRWLGHRDIKTTLRYLEATAAESEAAQKATEAVFGSFV